MQLKIILLLYVSMNFEKQDKLKTLGISERDFDDTIEENYEAWVEIDIRVFANL